MEADAISVVEPVFGRVVLDACVLYPASLDPYGIVALSPDNFLQRLLDVGPSLMLRILRGQAADLVNSRRTLDNVLGALATQAPRFAARARAVSE